MANESRYNKKFEVKDGGKNGTIPPSQFPCDFNNDTHIRFNPKGSLSPKSVSSSSPKQLQQ